MGRVKIGIGLNGKGAGVVSERGGLNVVENATITTVAGIEKETFLIVDKDKAVEITVEMAGTMERIPHSVYGQDGATVPGIARKDVPATEGFDDAKSRSPRGEGGYGPGKKRKGEEPEAVYKTERRKFVRRLFDAGCVKSVEEPAGKPGLGGMSLAGVDGDVEEEIRRGAVKGGRVVEVGTARAGKSTPTGEGF